MNLNLWLVAQSGGAEKSLSLLLEISRMCKGIPGSYFNYSVRLKSAMSIFGEPKWNNKIVISSTTVDNSTTVTEVDNHNLLMNLLIDMFV